MDCLAEEDVKPLCRLDDWTDLAWTKLEKGMVQGGAEISGTDPSQISAVDSCDAVRMKLGLKAEALRITLQSGVKISYSPPERIFRQLRGSVLSADKDVTGAALFRKTK